MKNDPHLYSAEIPIVAGLDVEALCQKPITRAQVVMMWDSLVVGKKVDLEGSRICARCLQALAAMPTPDPEERTYLFGILSGGADAV